MGDPADLVVTVHVPLDEEAWSQVQPVLQQEGWNQEEGLRILLGYGAAVHLLPPPDDPLRALGAARAELATLRHRAYLADEAVRSLRMNLVGLQASVAQAHRSLESWGRTPAAPSLPAEGARQAGGASEVTQRLPKRPTALFSSVLGGTRPEGGDPRRPGARPGKTPPAEGDRGGLGGGWFKRLLGRWRRGR